MRSGPILFCGVSTPQDATVPECRAAQSARTTRNRTRALSIGETPRTQANARTRNRRASTGNTTNGECNARRNYRASSVSHRLPDGLPSLHARRQPNGLPEQQRTLQAHSQRTLGLVVKLQCRECDNTYAFWYGWTIHNKTYCKKRPTEVLDQQLQFQCEACEMFFATKAGRS